MALFLRRDEFVKNVLGPAVAGAQVYVCDQPANSTAIPPSPLSILYGDSGGLTQLTQPLITDGFGHTYFYAAPGTYTIIVVDNGVTQQIYPDQSLGSGVVLETNGTPNTNQAIENLVAGASIALTPDGFGATIIDVTTPPLILQTNFTLNPDQSLLNLNEGAGISIVDDGVGNITFSATSLGSDIMFTNWHKVTFANTAGQPDFVGDGIHVVTVAFGGLLNGIQYRPPYNSEPIALQIGGAQPQEAAVYEFGASSSLGVRDSKPINLTTLVRWQALAAVGTIFLPAWVSNFRVQSGTVLFTGGTYYIQTGSATADTVTAAVTMPTFDSTPGNTTADGTATWMSVGTTRPITFSDHLIGISDYQGTNEGGVGYFQYPLGLDPTLTNATGPAYNFIGFRYLPEPRAANNNVGDTHWMAYAGGVDMTPQVVNTGVAPDNSGATHLFVIKQITLNEITFYIDGALVATCTLSGLINPFGTVIFGTNQGGDSNAFSAPYSNKPMGLGATLFAGGNFWSVVQAGTPSGIFSFPGGPTVGQTATDGSVVWMSTWASNQAPPMAFALSYIFWETSR